MINEKREKREASEGAIYRVYPLMAWSALILARLRRGGQKRFFEIPILLIMARYYPTMVPLMQQGDEKAAIFYNNLFLFVLIRQSVLDVAPVLCGGASQTWPA